MTILEQIKINSKKYPDRIAINEQLPDNAITLTWKELDEYSDNLAAYLKCELKTKTPIIVYGHKNPYMQVCFLACVKSGRAYCPIDVNVPLTRTEAIINKVNPEIILSTENIEISSDKIKRLDEIVSMAHGDNGEITSADYVTAEDVFYIIFTSGSTGVPKGVQITCDCLDNFIKWALTIGNEFENGKHYVFINQAPFSFDLSVMDMYLSLYTGGTLWCLTKSLQLDSKKLYESLGKSKGNAWISTPSFADVCLADPAFSQSLLPNLTDFLFCGEVLTNKTVERLAARFPNAKVVNTYGPTESTCAITQVVVTEKLNKESSPLPVGVPKNGTWLKIVDGEGKEVKNGERGEIVIIGDSVSVGYFMNEEKNKMAFGTQEIDGKVYRTYRTGDEGYLTGEMLNYCGRIDLQVKLHGYRIELEDIESNLLKIPNVVSAVVIPKYRDGKVSSLVAGVLYSGNVENIF